MQLRRACLRPRSRLADDRVALLYRRRPFATAVNVHFSALPFQVGGLHRISRQCRKKGLVQRCPASDVIGSFGPLWSFSYTLSVSPSPYRRGCPPQQSVARRRVSARPESPCPAAPDRMLLFQTQAIPKGRVRIRENHPRLTCSRDHRRNRPVDQTSGHTARRRRQSGRGNRCGPAAPGGDGRWAAHPGSCARAAQ